MAVKIGMQALIPAAVLQLVRLPKRYSRKNPH
jgi:hypothetical protein